MAYNRKQFLHDVLSQQGEFADKYAAHRTEQEAMTPKAELTTELMEAMMIGMSGQNGVCWNNKESWWVCDTCKSASENLVDFKHEPGCKHAA